MGYTPPADDDALLADLADALDPGEKDDAKAAAERAQRAVRDQQEGR